MVWYVTDCRITVNSGGGGPYIYKAESYTGACTAIRYMYGLVFKGWITCTPCNVCLG